MGICAIAAKSTSSLPIVPTDLLPVYRLRMDLVVNLPETIDFVEKPRLLRSQVKSEKKPTAYHFDMFFETCDFCIFSQFKWIRKHLTSCSTCSV